MNKYAIASGILFVTLLILTSFAAAKIDFNQRGQTSSDDASPRACVEGHMECEANVGTSCKHRTCNGGSYADWVSFGSNYACETNSNDGGGSRCTFQRSRTCEAINDKDCIPITEQAPPVPVEAQDIPGN